MTSVTSQDIGKCVMMSSDVGYDVMVAWISDYIISCSLAPNNIIMLMEGKKDNNF